MYSFDAMKIKDEVIRWIIDFFEENGKGCKAVVGISGGKDSSIVANLCVEALGKERVIGVLMPQGRQYDIEDSINLCDYLDIQRYTINIMNPVLNIKREVKRELEDRWSKQTSTNLPARIRMAVLYAVAQTVGGRVSNNCNLSEDWVGYSTRYGDTAGDFSPLCKLTVSEVKAIGYALKLPKEFIEKVPSDGLCGKSDEDNLGFSYDMLDKYIRTNVCPDEKIKNRIDFLHQKNAFKLRPMPHYCYVVEESKV